MNLKIFFLISDLELVSQTEEFTVEDKIPLCPNGHKASMMFSSFRFWKRYIPPKLKNDVKETDEQ
jgi:hypothetical protein